MDFLLSFGKAILIGMGAILPGVSSGVICVILGIYEDLVNSILGLFKNFKKNFLFLFPFIIGFVISFFMFGNLLNYLFSTYESECKLLFLGLILGTIPNLFKEINNKNKFKLSFLFYTLVSFLLGFLLFILEEKISNSYLVNQSNFFFLFLSGIAMSTGVVIPGVSSTVILMCFGTYFIYLEAITTFNLSVLIPIGLGLCLGCILFLYLIRFLLKNYTSETYFSIIGFILGSTFILLPNHFSLLSIILFIVGFIIALKLEK